MIEYPRELDRSEWTPDSACSECPKCGFEFYFFSRRHHCRLCGQCFCDDCSSFRVQVEGDYRVRSCRECAEWVQRRSERLSVTKEDSIKEERKTTPLGLSPPRQRRRSLSWTTTTKKPNRKSFSSFFDEGIDLDSLFCVEKDTTSLLPPEEARPLPYNEESPPELSGKEPHDPWWKQRPPCRTCSELCDALKAALNQRRWAEAQRLLTEDATSPHFELPQDNHTLRHAIHRLVRHDRVPEGIQDAAQAVLITWKHREDALTPPKFAVGDAVLFIIDSHLCNTDDFYAPHHYDNDTSSSSPPSSSSKEDRKNQKQETFLDATIIAVRKGPPHAYTLSLLEEDDHHEADETMLKPMPPGQLLSL